MVSIVKDTSIILSNVVGLGYVLWHRCTWWRQVNI